MERDPLTAALENLCKTYMAIGQEVRGCQSYALSGLQGVVGPVNHAIGNFGVSIRPDRTSAFEAWRLARDHPNFIVYAGRNPEDPNRDPWLVDRGFEKVHQQNVMVAGPRVLEKTSSNFCVLPVQTRESRLDVTEFVARQFFGHVAPAIRDEVARALGRAGDLDIFATWDALEPKTLRNLLGAYSLVEGDVMGIYNLCVDAPLRGRGIGSIMVQKLFESRPNRHISLQCDEPLVKFYERLGFRHFGWVSVYALPESG